jgi:integrase
MGPYSSGEKTKTAAGVVCVQLYAAGRLIPKKTRVFTFGDFAKGFWERNSSYIKNQDGRADLTDSYLDKCRQRVINRILPTFEKIPLDKITAKDINQWLLDFKKEGYKNTYANTVFKTLHTMLAYAARQELIPVNPCANVKKLKNDRKKIEILTVEETRKLFGDNWREIWDDKDLAYATNRLACLTGMRAGEIAGLRGEYVFDDYISVCGQYGAYGYGPTKTKEPRFIPLIPEMIEILKKLMEKNGKGYVFSENGGATPVTRRFIYDNFHRALMKIGIDKTEIARRGLSVHSWRHFLNTELQRQGLTLQQVQSVTGHKSDRMSDLYNHPDARQIEDVTKAQEKIAKSAAELQKERDQENKGNIINMRDKITKGA